MISIKQFMELVNYRISEGGKYCWNCYGEDAYTLDSWDGDQNGSSFTIIFDTKTQMVFEVQAHDYRRNRAYRMINPLYEKANREEARNRESDWAEAWEDVNYVDLETDDDFLEKATCIFDGEDYDTRVSIPVDFTDEELLRYMTLAHERDITFNQLIEEALRAAVDEAKQDPEGFKARAQARLAAGEI